MTREEFTQRFTAAFTALRNLNPREDIHLKLAILLQVSRPTISRYLDRVSAPHPVGRKILIEALEQMVAEGGKL